MGKKSYFGIQKQSKPNIKINKLNNIKMPKCIEEELKNRSKQAEVKNLKHPKVEERK